MRELERHQTDSSAIRTVRTVASLRDALAPARRRGASVGLVPTMGAFHEGHLSLMRKARADCDMVVVSLFVNPRQFGESEDFTGYPRDVERDSALARRVGVDLLFAPSLEEVYPPGFSTTVEVAGLSETLCGSPESRGAGHFRGVATVVTKLLNICQPQVAYFGAKDFQQALLIERLVRDLNLPVSIEICPIVRDHDGLALSSRNAYLSRLERQRALSLKRALDAAEQAIRDGTSDPETVRDAAQRELDLPGVEPEYVEVVSALDLSPLEAIGSEAVLIAVAARIGRARLIDNTVVRPEAAVPAPSSAAHSYG
jgi:pantoate--beta-alanine ligase